MPTKHLLMEALHLLCLPEERSLPRVACYRFLSDWGAFGGLGLKVWGLGFGLWGLRFRVRDCFFFSVFGIQKGMSAFVFLRLHRCGNSLLLRLLVFLLLLAPEGMGLCWSLSALTLGQAWARFWLL